MQNLDLLSPWLTFAVILIPLVYLERWIHQHLYGVGWLLTQEKERATLIYYIILLPGVFLHEFTQWVVAGALKQKTSKVKVWPKPQANGSIRYDFVKLSRKTRLPASLAVGFAPLLTGIIIILFISQNIFSMPGIGLALKSRNLEVVFLALQNLFGTPDFWLWLYLLFAIGNAMLPTPSEIQGWPYILVIFAVITVLLFIIGLGEQFLIATMRGPVTQALQVLAAAFSAVLIVDIFAVLGLGITEQLLEKITGQKARYPKPKTARPPKPEPGGEAPLSSREAPLRITERPLPIPPPPKRKKKTSTPLATTAQVQQSPLPASSSDNPQDTLQSTTQTSSVFANRRSDLLGDNSETTQNEVPELRQASVFPDSQGDDTEQYEPPENTPVIDDTNVDDLHYEDLEDMP
ncbi:hypothetical protein ACFLYO_01695 [Chloroflexota bacterium]